jgi:hypothetical protein
MVNSPNYYRIFWRSLLTDASGNGQRILGYDKARNEVLSLNRKYSGFIEHWVE